jgi:hypothetical protein
MTKPVRPSTLSPVMQLYFVHNTDDGFWFQIGKLNTKHYQGLRFTTGPQAAPEVSLRGPVSAFMGAFLDEFRAGSFLLSRALS